MGVSLLAPAGSFEALSAALANGADAVYFGVGNLNMRSRGAVNFTEADLPAVAARCHACGAKAWMTLNIVVYDSEIGEVRRLCAAAKAAGVDAVIAADMAVIEAAGEVGLSVHLSVQANISNLAAVRFYARYADVMVLARELSLEQIAAVVQGIEREQIKGPSGELVKIEVFVHGALCVAVSGKCYMSLAVFNTSANRGDCFQVCRRAYTVRDAVKGNELEIENRYVMSPKDLCTIEILPRLLEAGVSVLKIEGRGRSADYTAAVTAVYREGCDLWLKGEKVPPETLERWKKRLNEVFNRGFWEGGYYLGEETGIWAASAENRSSLVKVLCGRVVNYFARPEVVQVQLTAGSVSKGDRILITGPTTGAVEGVLTSLYVNDKEAETAAKGDEITFTFDTAVRKNDSFFLLTER